MDDAQRVFRRCTISASNSECQLVSLDVDHRIYDNLASFDEDDSHVLAWFLSSPAISTISSLKLWSITQYDAFNPILELLGNSSSEDGHPVLPSLEKLTWVNTVSASGKISQMFQSRFEKAGLLRGIATRDQGD